MAEYSAVAPAKLPASPAESVARPERSAPRIDRALSLDALRGLFILLMNLGFTIPLGVFPDWMYHRQYPSSGGGEYHAIAGIAWRDVTFASFLFTMAAAIPVTMTARMDRGMTWKGVILTGLRRGFFLYLFALIIGHSNPFWTNDYTARGNITAICGYLLCFLVFTRPRSEWPKAVRLGLPIAGWIGVLTLFAISPKLFGQMFSIARRDDVIAIIMFGAVSGILIWTATRTKPLGRLALLAIVIAVHVASREEGWAHVMWSKSPLPWLFEWMFVDTLLVVIPGLLAGDLLVQWMKSPKDETPQWSRMRLVALALLAICVEPLLVAGLYNRWILGTTLAFAGLCIIGALLVRNPFTATERFVSGMLQYAAFWVFIGLLIEPLGGGIKKIPGTMSYYLTMAGNAMCLLAAFAIVFDILHTGRRIIKPFVEVGQNSMMGYMLLPMFVIPILSTANLYVHGVKTPAAAIIRGALMMCVVAAFTGFFSRRKIFWRT